MQPQNVFPQTFIRDLVIYGVGACDLFLQTRVVNIAILYWYWQDCQYFFQYCQSIAILLLNQYWYWYWQYYYEYW